MTTDRFVKPSFIERIKVDLVSGLGYWIIRIIGSTLRWKVEGRQNLESIHNAGKRFVAAFWHGRMFMAAYFFRRRGIVVMISQNRDGEYIARVIRRLGYGVARGSSTRGSRGAIVEILLALKRNLDVAFTLDGPLGPRYIAKPGAAYVAWKSGHPVMPFNISAEKKWVMRSWDHFIVPKPFSRAVSFKDHAWRAETTLNRSMLNECFLQGMKLFAFRKTLDSYDLFPRDIFNQILA